MFDNYAFSVYFDLGVTGDSLEIDIALVGTAFEINNACLSLVYMQ